MDKGCLATDAYFMAGYFIDRSVLIMRLMYDHPFLMRQSHDGVMETKGKVKERKGKERKGKERKVQERTGKERKGQDRTGQDRKGKERGILFVSIEFPSVCFLPSMQESFPHKQP